MRSSGTSWRAGLEARLLPWTRSEQSNSRHQLAADFLAGDASNMPDTFQDQLCVDLDASQIEQLEAKYKLRFDDPDLPTSAGSGPGDATVSIHPAAATDDCGDCRQLILVATEEESALDDALKEIAQFVKSIGGRACS